MGILVNENPSKNLEDTIFKCFLAGHPSGGSMLNPTRLSEKAWHVVPNKLHKCTVQYIRFCLICTHVLTLLSGLILWSIDFIIILSYNEAHYLTKYLFWWKRSEVLYRFMLNSDEFKCAVFGLKTLYSRIQWSQLGNTPRRSKPHKCFSNLLAIAPS